MYPERPVTSRIQDKYAAPALDKGLDILELLARAPKALTQTELARALGRTQSQIYRMLECLVRRGYLVRDDAAGTYRLSLKLYALSHVQNRTTLIRRAALQPMEELAERSGQSCHLSLPFGSEVLVVMERLPQRSICLAIGEGTTIPFSTSASGVVILSRIDDPNQRLQLLQRDEGFTRMPRKKQTALLKEIEKMADQPYLITMSQITPGGVDLAAPIGIPETDAFGVLAMSYVEGKPDPKTRQQRLDLLLQCAETINKNLGLDA